MIKPLFYWFVPEDYILKKKILKLMGKESQVP